MLIFNWLPSTDAGTLPRRRDKVFGATLARTNRPDAPRSGNSLLQNRADYERQLIRKALEECQFNRSSAARALGVSRVTLHKKIKQYGLADLP